MFWFAVQTYTGLSSFLRSSVLTEPLRRSSPDLSAGSECVYQMLKAIWPSVASIPNRLDGHITTTGMMCYFLFWLVQLPFLFISPQGLRWLFMVKALMVPPTFLAMMIWAFATTDGGEIFHQQGTLNGSALAWAWLGALNSTLGIFSTLAVNIPDFTRYARCERE
jgi:NCS1 family nucleobase:cation symporter-1